MEYGLGLCEGLMQHVRPPANASTYQSFLKGSLMVSRISQKYKWTVFERKGGSSEPDYTSIAVFPNVELQYKNTTAFLFETIALTGEATLFNPETGKAASLARLNEDLKIATEKRFGQSVIQSS